MLAKYIRDNTIDIDVIQDYLLKNNDSSVINEVDNHCRTPLHLASWKGNDSIVKLLLEHNADVSLVASDNFTALHFASQCMSVNSSKCIALLGSHDKDLIDKKISKGGKTSLHLAATKGNFSNVQTLLELGADPFIKTNSGDSADVLAKDRSIVDLIQMHMKKRREDSAFVQVPCATNAKTAASAIGTTYLGDDTNSSGSDKKDMTEVKEQKASLASTSRVFTLAEIEAMEEDDDDEAAIMTASTTTLNNVTSITVSNSNKKRPYVSLSHLETDDYLDT